MKYLLLLLALLVGNSHATKLVFPPINQDPCAQVNPTTALKFFKEHKKDLIELQEREKSIGKPILMVQVLLFACKTPSIKDITVEQIQTNSNALEVLQAIECERKLYEEQQLRERYYNNPNATQLDLLYANPKEVMQGRDTIKEELRTFVEDHPNYQ